MTRAATDPASRSPDGDRPREAGPLEFVVSREGVSGEGGFRLEVLVASPMERGRFVSPESVWSDESFGSRGRIDATMEIGRAAAAWAPLRRLLDQEVPGGTALDLEEVGELLDGADERLARSNITVRWAPELDRSLSARVAVGISEARQTSVPDVFDGDDPIAFRWELTLDDVPLDEEERLAVAWTGTGVAAVRDREVLVGPSMARRARIPDIRSLTALDALALALTGHTEVEGERFQVVVRGWLADLREELVATPSETAGSEEDPPGLATELRGYQGEGLAWLSRMTRLGLGGCLADDMGLGKTVMLIALHLERRERGVATGPTLVVCPTSIVANWEREVARFAPGERVVRYHGPERSLDDPGNGFVVTSYGTLRRDVAELSAIQWDLIAADEAQHVKNHRSAAARALRLLPGRARVALTGTPLENRLSELWAILDWTTPGLLGGVTEFRRRWVRQVEEESDPEETEALSRLLGPFVLRRRKSDPGILPELPPKTEADHAVLLSDEQATLYEQVTASMIERINGASGVGRRGLVLELLTSLKQVCNHPAHYLGQSEPVLEGRSGKLDLFDDLASTAVGAGSSVLVFTQYVEMGKLLLRRLDELEIESRFLHGGTAAATRQKMVDTFQAGDFPVFVLSVKAGGQGLNLTRADHVIHYDRWWNPAVEDQATDRAHRIGQDGPVEVHRLIAVGTVEDRIAEIHRRKRSLAEAVVEAGPAAFTELGDEELLEVLRLRRT